MRPFTLADMEAACASSFEEGWFAWELTDVRPIQSTERVLAARDIYDVDFLPFIVPEIRYESVD